jgi:hypothetical protein
MSSPIRACKMCGESFWAIGSDGLMLQACPICAASALTGIDRVVTPVTSLTPVPAEPVQPGRTLAVPQLGFNCPSCFAVLFIKNPEEYDGRAAPCPHCQEVILAPRVAPASPFVLIASGSAADPGERTTAIPVLPRHDRAGRWKPFRRHEYGSPGRTAMV